MITRNTHGHDSEYPGRCRSCGQVLIDIRNNAMTITRELSLGDILAIEDSPAFLDFKCKDTGMVLWPWIRVPFFRLIISDLLYESPLYDSSVRQQRNLVQAMVTLARASAHNLLNLQNYKRDVMVTTVGIGDILSEGKFFNRLSDHFAQIFANDTVVLEDLYQWRWPFPRHFNRTLIHSPIWLKPMIVSRLSLRNRSSDVASKLIGLAKQRAKTILNWELGEKRESWLVQSLERKIVGTPFLFRSYESWLGRVKPKLLMVECACYGGPLSILLNVARRMGIVTAEYQHGLISAGHDAYNFAPTLQESSEYCAMLPGYFLGYGDWWNQQINAPVTKFVIGNPHRSEQIATFAKNNQGKTDILLLGQRIETTKFYLDLAESIVCAREGDCRVVFRPHPMARTLIRQQFPGGKIRDGVVVDNNQDIYQSFQSAYAVVSESSTGLFEAIGLVERIFSWDTPITRFALPSHPFQSFNTPDELVAMLRDSSCGTFSDREVEAIWAPRWKENYQRFVQGILCR